jgi:DNA-binding LytR/AlgR family response regulator
MDKVKVLVVEDEIIIADSICDALEELGYEALEPAINYTEAIATIVDEKPDIAILDIQLSGKKTGIDIAKKIRETFHFPFIFLTSNADSFTLNQAKEVRPPAYLIKPFSKDELFTSIEIAISNFSINQQNKKVDEEVVNQTVNQSIFVKHQGSYLKVLFDDILYLKSEHVYVELYLKNGKKLLIRKSLNDILGNLNANFIRVQRSFVVNKNYIKEIKTNSIKVLEIEIPIGKKFKEDLLQAVNLS